MATPFVHIVESPSPTDLLDGRTEGRVLVQALALANIPTWYSLTVNRDVFVEGLYARLVQALNAVNDGRPVLHLSTHGNEHGIVLTSGEFISWEDLRELLIPINKTLGGMLLVCMSSCYGFDGCRMAMTRSDDLPFLGLVAHNGPSTWSDAALAFATFYHQVLVKGSPIATARDTMRIASGDYGFDVIHGPATRQDFLRRLAATRPQSSQLPQAPG